MKLPPSVWFPYGANRSRRFPARGAAGRAGGIRFGAPQGPCDPTGGRRVYSPGGGRSRNIPATKRFPGPLLAAITGSKQFPQPRPISTCRQRSAKPATLRGPCSFLWSIREWAATILHNLVSLNECTLKRNRRGEPAHGSTRDAPHRWDCREPTVPYRRTLARVAAVFARRYGAILFIRLMNMIGAEVSLRYARSKAGAAHWGNRPQSRPPGPTAGGRWAKQAAVRGISDRPNVFR